MGTEKTKFERIDIWRSEVASSQTYCVCSAPALKPKAIGAFGKPSSSLGTPSIAEAATGTLPKQDKIQSTVFPIGDQKQHRPKFLSLGSKSNIRDGRRRNEAVRGNCSMCAKPTDGVEYKCFSSDGSGLVWRMNDASRSISNSIKRLEEGAPPKPGSPLFSRISQVFRRPKENDEPLRRGSERSVGSGLPSRPKAKTADWTDEVPGRSTGTEMYYLLRREKRLDAVVDNDTDDNTFSDESGKKPKIGIGKTAARLERAQKMLDNGDR
ncbi:hypothetical protein GGS20DRAFT_528463 [Poronia punctata]|nr:hypothetical protein GGS20DRAFT_528463 [Poronia punctata]